MTSDPMRAVQHLIDEKRSVYASMGTASSSRGKFFFVIWGKPSNKILARGYGDTVMDAAQDALSQVPNIETPQSVALPGLTTRPALPGMTR